ncbi:hypothetical protein LEP1GSC034_0704 [Leptospira interrogans str. 2003000735]|nr:hypothetical protein LEP1GSC027_2566 [Leptospira interrogans str. 2002000624]EKQ39795.1 hypothetical protein LEP1GSC025_1484 [Leptospira interrogans str. 2002000621]EKQ46579.1 hypothetical protein LEP1GSC026_1032 [Leptospira interrogans str. 2002000623]EMJ69125.1 hypothetical protein LEP1GSC034_0704 [Leptospira interrogans str. 2003000735]EMJ70354.1 hypothetical protein LEP1GSC033_4688 [Leptospira interrogans str. 2002000632]EMJ83365.1 hypothetical protein LEP1GSC032_1317 [Leptospira interr
MSTEYSFLLFPKTQIFDLEFKFKLLIFVKDRYFRKSTL